MTRLTLVRHAKSSWDRPGLSDRDRPLSPRGERDAPMMGRVLAGALPPPDAVLASPALRARSTAELIAGAWGLDPAAVRLVDGLYLAGLDDWWDAVSGAAPEAGHLLAVGHQPGVGAFASWLDPSARGDVPTCAVLSFEVSGRLARGSARLVFRDFPKAHRD